MPVKVECETVRGYKVEQFSDAFARALGVTSVTSVTSQSASQAGGNASNAGNAYPGEQAFPLLGDERLPRALLLAAEAGHLTEAEASSNTTSTT
jgi:hypothetical protein